MVHIRRRIPFRSYFLVANQRLRCDSNGEVLGIFVPPYQHAVVESKWQQRWEEKELFKSKRNLSKPKKYILDMFPYPSGSGLHVGHVKGYTATDVAARYYRMKGYDVLHPIGWDAFGLPAEQHAIKSATHPSIITKQNITTFRKQLKSLGYSYDWTRELSTTDAGYVRWTQWIFLQLFKKGLAFQSESTVNWCPKLGTVLANEEVINGFSERGSYPVTRIPLRQWSLRISSYGDRLAQDLDSLHWPKGTIKEQKKWINKSEGVMISFAAVTDPSHSSSESGSEAVKIEVFTTRPETIMGVTFLVLAPEHKLVPSLISSEQSSAVIEYQKQTLRKKDLERVGKTEFSGESGVALGSYAYHPITHEKIPIWIADYVLGNVGSGAVMGVPGHDRVDNVFAERFGLPVKSVIEPIKSNNHNEDEDGDDANSFSFCKGGTMRNSGTLLNGLSIEAARATVIQYLEEHQFGKVCTSYFNNREWIFSRQRYWGEPIPIYFPVDILPNDNALTSPLQGAPHKIRYDLPIAMDEAELPLQLPHLADFQPYESEDCNESRSPEGCLGRVEEWKYFEKDGNWFARETNTMPQWAGSCWYYLRFADPSNPHQPISAQADREWLPVDLYIGGQEHAVLHLLYARFWHKFLFDLGVVKDKEPFQRLLHQGMILGEDREKMSKSKGNVVSVDDFVGEHGADILRMYEMFVCPLEGEHVWSPHDLIGLIRFRNRIYYLLKRGILNTEDLSQYPHLRYLVHKTTKSVTVNIEKLAFKDLIEDFNELCNCMLQLNGPVPRSAYETLLLLIAPFAPHLSEECWSLIGHDTPISIHPWPSFKEEHCQLAMIELCVQINGKRKTVVKVDREQNQDQVMELVSRLPEIKCEIEGKTVKRIVYVSGKIVNFVIN